MSGSNEPDPQTGSYDIFSIEVRETLETVKCHPYPGVTLFGTNTPRTYRRDPASGHWVTKYEPEWFR